MKFSRKSVFFVLFRDQNLFISALGGDCENTRKDEKARKRYGIAPFSLSLQGICDPLFTPPVGGGVVSTERRTNQMLSSGDMRPPLSPPVGGGMVSTERRH